jgi:hypothetical protein
LIDSRLVRVTLLKNEENSSMENSRNRNEYRFEINRYRKNEMESRPKLNRDKKSDSDTTMRPRMNTITILPDTRE